jgi:hypothetical protein
LNQHRNLLKLVPYIHLQNMSYRCRHIILAVCTKLDSLDVPSYAATRLSHAQIQESVRDVWVG